MICEKEDKQYFAVSVFLIAYVTLMRCSMLLHTLTISTDFCSFPLTQSLASVSVMLFASGCMRLVTRSS